MNVFCQSCGLSIALPDQARSGGATFICPRCHHRNVVASTASVSPLSMTVGDAPPNPTHQAPQSSQGSGMIIGALIVFSMALWAPILALLIAVVLGILSIMALRKRGRVALSRTQSIHPIAALVFAIVVIGGAGARLAGEQQAGERKAQAERAAKEEAARLAAEKAAEERHAAAMQASKDAELRANAPAKAAEFNASLDEIQSAMAKEEWASALSKLESLSASADVLKTLDPPPAEFPPVLKRYEDLEQQVRPVAEALAMLDEATKKIVRADESVQGTKDGATWSAAKQIWQEAKSKIEVLDASPPAVRGFLPEGLAQMSRDLDARLKRAKRYADPYESELAEREALKVLCGDPPAGCGGGWDGECIGTKAAFKKIAHDPGSVDVENCTQPRLTKEHCWVSECTVRAKNALGAKVVSRHRFGFSTLGVEVLQ